MASQVEDRIEVGTCDKGNVFIFHRAERDGYPDKPINVTWTLIGGNQTIGTYKTRDGADAVARALCGENVTNEFIADNPVRRK